MSTPVAVFGPLVTISDVDRAVILTLRTWLPTYLAGFERERVMPLRSLPRPLGGSFASTIDDAEFLDHRLPAVVVTTAGWIDAPERQADGSYSAAYRVSVSAVTRGRTSQQTRETADALGVLVHQALVQQGTLGGLASETQPVGLDLRPLADTTGQGRYLAAALCEFAVYVDHIFSGVGGPCIADPDEDPDLDPYPDPDPAGDPDAPYAPPANVGAVTVAITPKTGS